MGVNHSEGPLDCKGNFCIGVPSCGIPVKTKTKTKLKNAPPLKLISLYNVYKNFKCTKMLQGFYNEHPISV